jgi:hypothetical protein
MSVAVVVDEFVPFAQRPVQPGEQSRGEEPKQALLSIGKHHTSAAWKASPAFEQQTV